ncbi:GT2 family glycosyltransferase [Ruminiclostridium sufflavum DSM 19573]|uniref:GT2 family glycosyltransferase n=2 Tax=Ruminiclostridium TaxID=1508657 RepID=A0A318XPC2_9FIRM|nr:GT2 family glycosyltransferase [Ruminiclostridium sufflavum DSM 19573]
MKISVIMPYKKRLENIRMAFEAMAAQTMEKSEFEIIVGVMEYCEKYIAVCRQFIDRINICSILVNEEWNVAAARNAALRQAAGEILVILDADMVVPANFLTNLYDRHFSFRQRQCVIGQMIDYSNNTENVDSVEILPFSHYEKLLSELEREQPFQKDTRWHVEHNIPWAFAWTALIALPRTIVEQSSLLFDENFRGYGVEDLEWAYRISLSGVPLLLKHDVWGIHLPHARNVNSNQLTEGSNYRYFLGKYPGYDVEIVSRLGDFQGNISYMEYKKEIEAVAHNANNLLSVLNGKVKGITTLVIGVIQDRNGNYLSDSSLPAVFDMGEEVISMPLAGISLPFEDQSMEECFILPVIMGFSDKYKDLIFQECQRVSKKIQVKEK